ncbi:MAG: alpha amylase C-terminal domain-containing protein [Ignavibacteria bacterium]|nr:alpha amylase C-terminal domain-containing protein [Ignavibacteria bacterium]
MKLIFESRGFQWLDFSDSDNSVIGFVRYSSDKKEKLLFTFNMTPVTRENYMFGVPEKGFYKEILNSNAKEFGGSGIGNLGGVRSDDIPRFEFQNSIRVTLPPLAVNVYKFMPEISENKEVTDLQKEINESDTEDIVADQTPESEISELTNESESVIEKIESETELILSEDDKNQNLTIRKTLKCQLKKI